jgi:segregation and condensation protein B
MSNPLIAPLEAILFISGNPLPMPRLAEILERTPEEIADLLRELQENLKFEGRGIRLVEVADGWQLVSAEECEEYIEKLSLTIKPKISSAMMEVLAITAYRQPITRPEMEQIRGVNCDRVVRQLHDLELIEDQGRKEVVGRPVLYGTTSKFLHTFGLKSIESLPRWEEFKEQEQEEPVAVAEESAELTETSGEVSVDDLQELEQKQDEESSADEGETPEGHS